MFYFMAALNNSSLFFSLLHNRSKCPKLQAQNIWRRLEPQERLSGHLQHKGFPQQMLRICQFGLFDTSLCSALSLSAGRTPPSVCQYVRTHMYAYTDTGIIRTLYRLAGTATVTQKGRKGTDLSRLVRR